MSGESVHANFESLEGTVSSETTLTLNRRSRKISISNDSSTLDLSFKFNASESFGTLKPTETVSLYIRTNEVIINGGGVAYRIWVFG